MSPAERKSTLSEIINWVVRGLVVYVCYQVDSNLKQIPQLKQDMEIVKYRIQSVESGIADEKIERKKLEDAQNAYMRSH